MASEKMEKETPFLIVIGRQYASGGRRLGRYLSERLGVPFYDKRLLAEAAESMGFDRAVFVRNDEKRPSILRSIFALNYGSSESGYQGSGMSCEAIYSYQSEVIRRLCARESCVIVGRTADYVMRDHPRMASIFIHAPLEVRARRILEDGGAPTLEKAGELAQKTDKTREEYYNYYTNRHWGHADNYHLSLDSTRIGEESLLRIVKELLGLEQ